MGRVSPDDPRYMESDCDWYSTASVGRATKPVNIRDLSQIAQSIHCSELDAYLTTLCAERGLNMVFVGLAHAIGDALRMQVANGELAVQDADQLQSELERIVFVEKSAAIYVPMFSGQE